MRIEIRDAESTTVHMNMYDKGDSQESDIKKHVLSTVMKDLAPHHSKLKAGTAPDLGNSEHVLSISGHC